MRVLEDWNVEAAIAEMARLRVRGRLQMECLDLFVDRAVSAYH